MDQKERTLSLIMNKIYNKSIKLLALKIYLIKILKFNKTRDKQIIKRKMRVDKIQEKFNFISQLKTICMQEMAHNCNIFKFQKHQIKSLVL